MTKNLLKKMAVFVLAVCMLISIAACGGGTNNQASETTAEKLTPAASEETTTTAAASEEVTELNCFINESWWPVNTFTGIIPEEITKKTGVKLNLTVATDANSTQLGVMIASGELPDIVFAATNQDRLSNASLCYSYPELEEKFGVKIAGTDQQVKIAKSLTNDGSYYCLLNWFDTSEQWADLKVGAPGQTAIFYRKDLTDAANIKIPTNINEFKDALEAAKKAYPDMTPFGLGGFWKFQPFLTWTGLADTIYDTKTFYYDCSAPLYKDYLKYCNSLYRSGYVLAEDYANVNEADSHQKAYNSESVFYVWYATVGNLNQLQSETSKITPSAQWAVLAPLADDKGVMHASYGTGKGWAGTFVSKTCSNPEAAAKFIAYMFSEEGQKLSMWGREGIDYTEVDGAPKFSEEWLNTRKDSAKMNSTFNTWFYFGTRQTISLLADFSGIDESIASQFTPYGTGYKSYPEVDMAKPLSTMDEGVIYTKMEELRKSMEAKIIFSDSDASFESSFTEFMNGLDKIGVNTYNDYVNKKLAESK